MNKYMNSLSIAFTLTGFSLILLLSSLSVSSIQTNNVIAAVDVDTSGEGRAAAFDGETSIATDGDNFCSITDDIAGGKFSSIFEGIVDCDTSDSESNQFLVEYSYTKNPVKIGERTYVSITVKDKNSGNPISDAFIKLAIGSTSQSSDSMFSTALAAAAAGAGTITSTQKVVEDKTTQTMYTDENGRAAFTVLLGPKSDTGVYDTEIEISKDSYQSSFEQTDLRVI